MRGTLKSLRPDQLSLWKSWDKRKMIGLYDQQKDNSFVLNFCLAMDA